MLFGPAQRLQLLRKPTLTFVVFNTSEQGVQIITKSAERETGKIRRRNIQFHQRIFKMFDRAMPNAAFDLMVRGRDLNQALHEKAPRFVVALPNLLPGFMRFPKLAGIEQCNTVREIGAILFTQLRRELRGVRGRRP